ncbi:MAG TPA: hypothetical protein VKU38_19740 [Ktedonobacteraceae bacterium]|nr:hypothetical protein [Ktedonobacteraceae bacterium]
MNIPLQFTILGTAQDGICLTALASGTYRITIVNGSYSTYPGPHWKSEIRIYKNKSIQWGVLPGDTAIEPVNFDMRIGDGMERTENEALSVAKNMSMTWNVSMAASGRSGWQKT